MVSRNISLVHSKVNLRIQSECEKIRARKTPNMHNFYAVLCNNIMKYMAQVIYISLLYIKYIYRSNFVVKSYVFIQIKMKSFIL